MIELIQRLIDRGHAYASGGDVYFNVRSLPEYGSTSAMAPVIQLDLSDSRNDTAFVMSSGLPGAGYAGCPPR
ncbi:hypothetical protein [Micromonospora sp. NBC_00898]|uniref:hypothetical protein n=1 Tax=Micromonospora sp. NBC_00898 TaxID=2975981 RepID=UPI00386F6B87